MQISYQLKQPENDKKGSQYRRKKVTPVLQNE